MSYDRYADFKKAYENDRDNVIPINNVLENARDDFSRLMLMNLHLCINWGT